MDKAELKDYLDLQVEKYNQPEFLQNDPVQIPHLFTKKQDIEISGFLTSIISWGNRKAILKSAHTILDYLDQSPHDFIVNFEPSDINKISGKPVHRTFDGDDLICFLNSLQQIYCHNESMEDLFLLADEEINFYHAAERFRKAFVVCGILQRTEKHISSTYKNSSSKRLMMFLRWMVRNDNRGVDFGIWTRLNPAHLSIPLDVHTGNMSRKIGILTRKQNDWKAVEELDRSVRQLDPHDPAKYDFALFGLGASGDFLNTEINFNISYEGNRREF